MLKKFKVTISIFLEAQSAEDAQGQVLKAISADELEVEEVRGGVLLEPRIHRFADTDALGECSFGRRAGDTKCHTKGTHKWAGRSYCRDHYYSLAKAA